jgi:ABC-type transport system involved in multi-copper enzyme maturation permease subunit
MLKLIKMDFYRLFSSKTIKIGALMACLVSVGYTLLSLGIIALVKFAVDSDPMMVDGLGFIIPQAEWFGGVDLSEVILSGTGVLALFIGCVMTASFIGSEQSCGYTKNFAGRLTDKGYMAFSRFIVTSVGQTIILAIYAIVVGAAAMLILGSYITGFDVKNLLLALSLRLILHVAVNAIIVFVCTLTRSHAVAMIVGCIFGLGITEAAYVSASMLLNAVKINIDIINYMPDGINSQLSLYTAGELTPKAIIVSVAFIIAFVGANYYVVRNRDVR